MWDPPHGLPQLKPDTGPRFIDQNADRYPWSPLEPVIRAVWEMHPEFDLGNIDIITDRSPLRKLFEFVSHENEDFQFGVQVVGKTAMFVRMEKQTRKVIPQGQFQGYRRAFQDEYMKVAASAEGSTSYHRIVEYRFGGVRLLVRSAVDAYLGDSALKSKQGIDEQDEEGQGSLVKSMRATALDTVAPSVIENPEAPSLTIIPGDYNTPHTAVAEFATRALYGKTPFVLNQKMPDLWFAQIPFYIKAAYQNSGTKRSGARSLQPRMAEFVNIDILPMKERLAEWAAENAKTISGFLKVLRQVLDAAREMKAPCLVSYKRDEDTVLICKATDQIVPVLSEDLRKKWFASSEATEDSQQLKRSLDLEEQEQEA